MIVRKQALGIVILIALSTLYVSYHLTSESRSSSSSMLLCPISEDPTKKFLELNDNGKISVPAETKSIVLQLGVNSGLTSPPAGTFVIATDPNPLRRASALYHAGKHQKWRGLMLPFGLDRCDGVLNRDGWKIGVEEAALPVALIKLGNLVTKLPNDVPLKLVILDGGAFQMQLALQNGGKMLSLAHAIYIKKIDDTLKQRISIFGYTDTRIPGLMLNKAFREEDFEWLESSFPNTIEEVPEEQQVQQQQQQPPTEIIIPKEQEKPATEKPTENPTENPTEKPTEKPVIDIDHRGVKVTPNNKAKFTKWEEKMRDGCAGLPILDTGKKQHGVLAFKEFGAFGRLGNQLFQYAAMLALGRRLGIDPKLPNNWRHKVTHNQQSYMHHFDITMQEMSAHEEANCCPHFFEETESDRFSLDEKTIHLQPNTNLKAYFFSWKYQCNVYDDLRKEFTLKQHLRDKANSQLDLIKQTMISKGTASKDSVMVAVHVRRGDILSQHDWFRVPTVDYLHAAMDWFIERYEKPIFVICSGGSYNRELSDIRWCEQNIRRPNTYFSEAAEDFEDFALLSNCDHAIITSGTFGWWTAWMTRGDVIAWKSWQKQNFYQGHDDDFFPPGWVLLE